MTTSRRDAVLGVLERLPTATVSRAAGRLARLPVPKAMRARLWARLAGRLGMQLEEAARSPEAYRSFDALFTRRLREGARPVEWTPGALVAPADGRVTWCEPGDAAAIGVKGEEDGLRSWLGRDELPWDEPWVAVIYLSPRDYHRVHSPVAGRLTGVTYTPGRLVPVNPVVAGDGRRVFARNERVTCWLETDHGPVAVALIGATCVGGMEVGAVDLQANRSWRRSAAELALPSAGLAVAAGDELGAFHMGSSVVIVWERADFRASPALVRDRAVLMGQHLGRWEGVG
jgi:phosphatidylserine decarboxylase